MKYLADGFVQAFALLAALDAETFAAVLASVKTTALALAVAAALGIPAGFALGYGRFPGRRGLRLVSDTLLAFPTVLIGLLVYAFISRRGPLGGFGLLFSIAGMAIGSAILALPIAVSLTAQAVESLDPRVRDTALTLGARGFRVALACLAETRYQIMLAMVAAFGRVITEVGIAMMLGGNIKWETRTITTAIALETGKGDFARGIALGFVLLAIAFAVNAMLVALRRRAAR
jgi:tungstate transport system permease protein